MPSKSSRLARASARLEASLSTHAFLYLSLVAYTIVISLFFLAGFHAEWTYGHDPTMRWFISIARGSGYVLNFLTPLLLLLASRLFHTLLRLTPISSMLPLDHFFPALHIATAYTVIAALLIHVPMHLVWIIGWSKWTWGIWQVNHVVITGSLLLAVFVLLVILSRPSFRKRRFAMFRQLHIGGAALFYALLLLHGMYRARPETYKFLVPVFLVYALDRLKRRLALGHHTLCTTLNPTESVFLTDSVLRVRVPRRFNFLPGQYAELRVPSLGREWHPFTIASAPHDDHLTFYIKNLGDWTSALHAAVRSLISAEEASSGDLEAGRETENQTDAEAMQPLSISVRGPFGAPAQQFSDFSRVILISGGIGATPFASICRHLHFMQSRVGFSRNALSLARTEYRPGSTSLDQSHRLSLDSGYIARPSSSCPNTPRISVESKSDSQHPVSKLLDTEKRLQAKVSERFGVNVAAPDPFGIVERHGNYIADLLRIRARGGETDYLHDLPDGYVLPPSVEGAASVPEPDKENGLSEICLDENGPQILKQVRTGNEVDGNGPLDLSRSERQQNAFGSDEKYNNSPPSSSPANDHGATLSTSSKSASVMTKLRHLLEFLHTTRVNFFVLTLILLRTGIVAAGALTGSDYVMFEAGNFGADATSGLWGMIMQISLFAPAALTLAITIGLETFIIGLENFLGSARRIFEATLFGPVSLIFLCLEIRRVVLGIVGGDIETFLQYVLVLPTLIVTVTVRLWRSIGRRGLLVAHNEDCDGLGGCCPCGNGNGGKFPAVDFIWSTPKLEEDRWLRAELSDLANGSGLRLHRYATREGNLQERTSLDNGTDEEEVAVAGWQTHTGRPNWEKIFGQVLLDVPSHGVVGIFFCGPHAMGKAVRDAAKKTEMWSNLKGAYLRSTPEPSIRNDLQLSSGDKMDSMRELGCRVRFVYREENFN